MRTLGIHDGHNSSACLLIDGKVEMAIGEERLNLSKHAYGYPKNAISKIFESLELTIEDIDCVAMATPSLPPAYFMTGRNQNFTIADYWKEQEEYWYPKLYEGENPAYCELFGSYLDPNAFPYDTTLIKHEFDAEGMLAARKKYIAESLGCSEDKLSVFDHHECHAYYGYANFKSLQDQPFLIFTIDGGGDGVNATVSVVEPGKLPQEISRSSNCNIGRMYRYTTLLLGMRPTDHEYKLMGLAAYNSHEFGRKAYEVYAETLKVDKLGFSYTKEIPDHFFYFKDALKGQRFDAIAYGIQKRTEELLCEWVLNGVEATGIGNVVMTGGVAQNIKANKLICENTQINSFLVPPGPGDESISIGASVLGYTQETGRSLAVPAMQNAYVGHGYTPDQIEKAVTEFGEKGWRVSQYEPTEAAGDLANGEILGRFAAEKMEFGARALGNRSIIADPRNAKTIHSLNKLVKMRDFWMPFAPSVLEEALEEYFILKEGIGGEYMSVGFDTTTKAQSHLTAGLHPFDGSARPQFVSKSQNPGYHRLISCFREITGVGGVLNTSFNIHGEPIVGTPAQALDTFNRCGLTKLILGHLYISKSQSDPDGK